ncbi:hypothetical protein CDAR_374801 [Caerostris darwini]|uniref:Uncharacterized protein n=1 Tax=Caerostris darwini TaxID=1538125 RepID=A0AAV4RPN4_9ARAC|nr:hypothetical protein CDAR_374801 [Caerostris darwini]
MSGSCHCLATLITTSHTGTAPKRREPPIDELHLRSSGQLHQCNPISIQPKNTNELCCITVCSHPLPFYGDGVRGDFKEEREKKIDICNLP